jgi:hypothetical protein
MRFTEPLRAWSAAIVDAGEADRGELVAELEVPMRSSPWSTPARFGRGGDRLGCATSPELGELGVWGAAAVEVLPTVAAHIGPAW